MVQRVRPYIGTLVSIDAEAPVEAAALAAVESAFAAIERVGRLLHPRAGSDSEALRAAAVGQRVRLDAWSYEVLTVCRELHAVSHGVFDPCLSSRPGRMDAIGLSVAGCAMKLAEVELDFGGIAKGFAIDRAVDALRDYGCTSGLVNAGGDLRVFGPARSILLRKQGEFAHRLDLVDEALAVSEPKSTRSPREHLGFYLGTTGERIAGSWVAVVAPSAMLADGLAKCVMLCAPEISAPLLARYGARVVTDPDAMRLRNE